MRTGFLDFFNALGGVQAFGFPKTEARVDTNAPGTVHIAAATPDFIRQYFQAAVIEYHPLDPQDPVKLRLLGDDLRDRRFPEGAWRSFSAFNGATAVTAGQVYTPQIVHYTPPSPTPAAATPAPSPAPTTSPAPAVSPTPALDPLSAAGELIVVGTTDGGVLLYDGANWRQLDKDRSVLGTNRVQAVLVDKDGQIWAGTDAGLFRFDRNGQGAEFRQANTGGGIGSDDVRTLAGRQASNGLWMGHASQGASRFDGQAWDRLRPDNTQMPSSDVRQVRTVVGVAGGLSFATPDGAALYDEIAGTWFFYNTTNSEIASNNVTAVEADPGGALWFGTADAGVSRTLNPLAWDHFDTREGLGSNNVRDILVASDGTVWIATSGGVSSFQNGQLSTANVVNAGLPSNSVRALAEDSQGHIWVATDGGVGRFDGSTWTAFTIVQGLPTNNASSIATGVVVTS